MCRDIVFPGFVCSAMESKWWAKTLAVELSGKLQLFWVLLTQPLHFGWIVVTGIHTGHKLIITHDIIYGWGPCTGKLGSEIRDKVQMNFNLFCFHYFSPLTKKRKCCIIPYLKLQVVLYVMLWFLSEMVAVEDPSTGERLVAETQRQKWSKFNMAKQTVKKPDTRNDRRMTKRRTWSWTTTKKKDYPWQRK